MWVVFFYIPNFNKQSSCNEKESTKGYMLRWYRMIVLFISESPQELQLIIPLDVLKCCLYPEGTPELGSQSCRAELESKERALDALWPHTFLSETSDGFWSPNTKVTLCEEETFPNFPELCGRENPEETLSWEARNTNVYRLSGRQERDQREKGKPKTPALSS